MRIKAAAYIADFMASHGVTDNFSVTGGGAMHLNDAIGHHEKIRTTYNHHEQGSAVAAEAYARVTGRIALLTVTSGPGGTNAITGVMGGWLDSIPMFVLSGQVKRETTIHAVPELALRQLGDQEFDIIGSVSNMTKYAVQIREADDLAYHLEKAWYLMNEGRKGPVWLDVPLDIQGAPVDPDALRHFDPKAEGYETGDETDYDGLAMTVLQKIRSAKAPLLFLGYGVRLSGGAKFVPELLEKLRIPVQVAWNSCDLVPYDSPLFAGSPSREGTRGSAFVVQNADLILILGSRMNIRTITYNRHDFARNAYKIMVDVDENELKKPTFVPDLPIRGDVRKFMEALLRAPYEAGKSIDPWRSWARQMFLKYPAVLPEYHHETGKINPYVFLEKLSDASDEKDVFTLGNGSACVMTFASFRMKAGQRMFTNSGCASMGYGLPAGLGAAVAKRDEGGRVIVIDGDGSLMMNVQELATIAYHKLNLKLFVLNNNGYHSIRQTQTNLFHGAYVGIDPASGVGFPDFEKLAEAFGFTYFELREEGGADRVIREALQAEGPVFVNAVVDENQLFVPKLSSKVLPDGRIVSPSMDDMFPFLPREEYEANRYRPESD